MRSALQKLVLVLAHALLAKRVESVSW